MHSVRKRLSDEGLLGQLFSDAPVDALLTAMQIDSSRSVSAQREEGQVVLGLVESALGVLDLNIVPPGPNVPRAYVLTFEGAPGARSGFRLAVSLAEGPAQPLFKFLEKLPGQGLRAAVRKTGNDKEWLEEVPGDVQLAGAGVWLVLAGRLGSSIALRLSPRSEAPDDVVTLQLQPATVLVGQSGFGLELPQGLVIDLAEDAATAQRARVDGHVLATPADLPAWRGLAINAARLYLPRGVPFLGEQAVDAVLQVGLPPAAGAALVVHAKVPPKDKRPEIEVRIECLDPSATGLDGLVPTLVEAVMTLPLDEHEQNFGQPLQLGAGKPVRARARWARSPSVAGQAATSTLSFALESQGADGLVKIDSTSGGLGAKIAVTAATLASALVANGAQKSPAPDGDGTGVVLHTLLVAAMGLSAFLEAGQLVLHRAELVSTGGSIPLGKTMRLKIDYSVAAHITGINVGVLSLQMSPKQPLRVRVREVVLSIDAEKSGLEMIHLDYARSSLEVEDPGGWIVNGPGSLFDVLGTRSGRGSMWIEVDLRFKLDLGPVEVSGATIRATLDAQGHLKGSLRGLEAQVGLPGVIGGQGGVRLTEDGFRAALAVTLPPLGNMGAEALVETKQSMVLLALGLDLPGPLPLGSSGLAIYGLGGIFVANGRPKPLPAGADPITAALEANYRSADSYDPHPSLCFGLEAVIGTAPDLGFTFSARTGILITVPDLAVRGAVEGRFMGPRMKIARGDNGFGALQAKGTVVVDPVSGVTVALKGSYSIPRVLEVTVPVGAHFPRQSAAWFIHLGADGWAPPAGQPSEGREMGPVRAVLLPGLIDQSVDAYLMFRGDGITAWPRGGPRHVAKGTFMLACGFGFEVVYGLKPVVWAEVGARADILVSTNPMSFTGIGALHGSLNVAVFSIGVEAGITVVLMEGAPPYFRADVCGVIDLFFDEIRECITVHYNSPPPAQLPAPATHPLDREGGHSLVDDRYRKIGTLAADRDAASIEDTVWADAMPMFAFSSAPTLALASAQFPDVAAYPEGVRARPLGSDLLSYEWHLLDLQLVDATAADVLVAGPLSCAWLDGKAGDAANQPQPAELALLTPKGDLWLHAQGDVPADSDSPLGQRAGICLLSARARPGWALGEGAARDGSAWRLPASSISVDPMTSQPHARVSLWTVAATPRLIDAGLAQSLPGALAYTRPRVRPMPAAKMHAQWFNGWFDPGALLLPPGHIGPRERMRTTVDFVIELDDALSDAELWLVLPGDAWRSGVAANDPWVRVFDDQGAQWVAGSAAGDELDAGDGWLAVRWRSGGAAPVRRITARLWLGMRVGVMGVHGITASASAAAIVRNAAAANEAAKQAATKAAGPAASGAAPTATSRCVLKPGRLYRIDITMAWSGTLWKQDDQGVRSVLAQQALDASTTSTRSYWYRTAPLQDAATRGDAWREGTSTHFALMHRRQDLFDPQMLERLLRHYEPAQSELHRFAHDRVRVLFAPSHADALAGAYGFKLHLALRRLDQPASIEGDRVLKPKLTWAELALLDKPGGVGLTVAETLVANAYLASPCGLAPDAALLHAPVKLSRDAWYEVYVLAKSQKSGVADGRLRGVSFRTSRWANASEMLAALSLPTTGVGQALGSVALAAAAPLAPRALEGNDAWFDQALQAFGLEGWPAASEPRVSLLWRKQAGVWLCAGVFIESPEPVHRPGRLELQQLRLAMGSATRSFDLRLSDRAGHRVLWATSAPFAPRRTRPRAGRPLQNPQLLLVCRDLPPGGAARTLTGRLEVPLAPSFAQEALA